MTAWTSNDHSSAAIAILLRSVAFKELNPTAIISKLESARLDDFEWLQTKKVGKRGRPVGADLPRTWCDRSFHLNRCHAVCRQCTSSFARWEQQQQQTQK
jgi:hypothetical protein